MSESSGSRERFGLNTDFRSLGLGGEGRIEDGMLRDIKGYIKRLREILSCCIGVCMLKRRNYLRVLPETLEY